MDDQSGMPAQEPVLDDELGAMSAVAKAVESLPDRGRARVIEWAAKRYGVATVPSRGVSLVMGSSAREQDSDAPDEHVAYETFAELFDRLSPRTHDERVLAAMYWLQVVQNQPTATSLAMTNILSDLGHRVDRIRDVLPRLQGARPALVLQVSRGSGKSGHRVVKLSVVGIRTVETALAAGGFENVG